MTYSLRNRSPRWSAWLNFPAQGSDHSAVGGNVVARGARMARVVWVYHGAPLRGLDGRLYTTYACGRQRADGTWAGWIEFVSLDGAGVLRTPHETTQPAFVGLINWAGGVTSAHLQAALERAIHAARRFAFTRSPTQSFYHEPSPPEQSVTGEMAPVPDPFLAYAKGDNVLRQQLAEVPSSLLRAMIIAYDFADSSTLICMP